MSKLIDLGRVAEETKQFAGPNFVNDNNGQPITSPTCQSSGVTPY